MSKSKANCQIFVRHLDKTTTDTSFESYFTNFGEVVFHKILREKNGRSRGLGLVEFANPSSAEDVLRRRFHIIDGQRIECKLSRRRKHIADKYNNTPQNFKSIPKHLKTIYVGNLNPDITQEKLTEYFEKFGPVENAYIIKDKNHRSKGYGFVTFGHPGAVDSVQDKRPHKIANKELQTVRSYPDTVKRDGKLPTTVLYIVDYADGVDVNDIEEYFGTFGNIVSSASKNKKAENVKYVELEFEDYDSVDVICLTRKHTIKGNKVTVRKYLSAANSNDSSQPSTSTAPEPRAPTPPISLSIPSAPPSLPEFSPPPFNPSFAPANGLYPSLPTMNRDNVRKAQEHFVHQTRRQSENNKCIIS